MAVWLPLGYCNEWGQWRAIIGLLHLAHGRTLCLGHRDLATSEAGSGPVHGVARVPSPVWHVYLRRVGGTFGRASKLPHTSPSWQAVADEIRASSSDVIVEIVPCDLGRATGEP